MTIDEKIEENGRPRAIIDHDRNPTIPEGSIIVRNSRYGGHGKIVWNPARIRLVEFDQYPERSGWRSGTEYVRNLLDRTESSEDRTVLNANVLDYLLEHQEEVPNNWKNKHIIFAGTLYKRCVNQGIARHPGDRYFRALRRNRFPALKEALQREGLWGLKEKILYNTINRLTYALWDGLSEFCEGEFNISDVYRGGFRNSYVPVYLRKVPNKT